MRRSANAQAIDHLNASLDLLKNLPDTPERDRQELALQIAIAEPLTAARGWEVPEVARAHRRAIELCLRVGKPEQLFAVQAGLANSFMMGSQMRKAQELGEQTLAQAQGADDPFQSLTAHFCSGCTHSGSGSCRPPARILSNRLQFMMIGGGTI